jgi:hypothetical protein
MARNVPVRAVLGPRTVPRWPQPGRCFFPFHGFGVTGETGEAMASLGPQTVAPREVRRTVLSLLGVQRTALPNPSVARGHRQIPRYRDIPATIATIVGRRTSLPPARQRQGIHGLRSWRLCVIVVLHADGSRYREQPTFGTGNPGQSRRAWSVFSWVVTSPNRTRC